MADTAVRSAAHQAQIDELEASLGPFEDAAWRADLALLEGSMRSAAVQWALDARTLARLAAAVPRSPGDDRGGTPWTSFHREVAVARRLSDQAVYAEVALSLSLVERHPATLRLLEQGRVPAHRARALVHACMLQNDDVVEAVEGAVAPRLDTLTPGRIEKEVARIALRIDAEAAARQEAVATAGRSATRRTLEHGQAEVSLRGPAVAVQRWWDALTERARALKAAGDPRSLGALRFDLAVTTDPRLGTGTDPLLSALGITAADPEAAPRGASAELGEGAGPAVRLSPPLTDDARCSRPVQANVTVPAATALGLSDEPGWLDGYGWISAPTSRRLLTVAELRKACVAPHSGQLIDLDDQIVRPRLSPTALRDAVRTMVLTPHELRDLVLTDQDQHDPSPALEAFVDARDRFCDGPTGTQVPARRSDKDHDRPWPTGPTAAWNLVSRSGRTHHLKHLGWAPVRDGTGTTWSSPAGQVVHAPAHRHPPEPLLRGGSGPPHPDQLASADRALTRLPARADHDNEPVGSDPEPPEEAAPAMVAPAPRGTTRHGWDDEPRF